MSSLTSMITVISYLPLHHITFFFNDVYQVYTVVTHWRLMQILWLWWGAILTFCAINVTLHVHLILTIKQQKKTMTYLHWFSISLVTQWKHCPTRKRYVRVKGWLFLKLQIPLKRTTYSDYKCIDCLCAIILWWGMQWAVSESEIILLSKYQMKYRIISLMSDSRGDTFRRN